MELEMQTGFTYVCKLNKKKTLLIKTAKLAWLSGWLDWSKAFTFTVLILLSMNNCKQANFLLKYSCKDQHKICLIGFHNHI